MKIYDKMEKKFVRISKKDFKDIIRLKDYWGIRYDVQRIKNDKNT